LRTDSATDTRSTASPWSSTSPSASAVAEASPSLFGDTDASSSGPPQRAALILAVALLLAAGIVAVLATRGSGAPDGAAKLVPADALLYAHASTAPGRAADARLEALAARFTTAREGVAALGASLTPAAGRLSFSRDVRPWLGDEVAYALLDAGPGRTQPMLVAAVADRPKAEALLAKLGAITAGAERGVALRRLPGQSVAAFAGTFLVAGPEPAVRAAIDREQGDGQPSLADARVYRRAAKTRDGGASADLFTTAAGLRHLLAGRSGLPGVAGRLLAGPQVEGVSAQAKVVDGGLKLTARVIRAPGGPARASFEPSMQNRVPAGGAAFLDLPSAGALADLVSRAGGGSFVAGLRDALPAVAGIELDAVLAPLQGEAALSIASGATTPVITLASRTRDEAATREALANLQSPLADRLAGGAPFSERDAGSTSTFTLDVTPELQPSYAVAKGLVVASTARSGLDQLRAPKAPLGGVDAFKRLAPDQGDKVEALGFLDPRQLLSLGEQGGLPALSPALRDDLGRIRSAGVVVGEDATYPTDTDAELTVQIP
jgi:hypothetical protein